MLALPAAQLQRAERPEGLRQELNPAGGALGVHPRVSSEPADSADKEVSSC